MGSWLAAPRDTHDRGPFLGLLTDEERALVTNHIRNHAHKLQELLLEEQQFADKVDRILVEYKDQQLLNQRYEASKYPKQPTK